MFKFWYDATMLSLEAQRVINLRMMKLALGGRRGEAEARRMATEKVFAAMEAGIALWHGGSGSSVLAGYRKRVRANSRRLSRR